MAHAPKIVPVRKTERVVNALSQEEMMTKSREDLVRLVARLTRAGMNSEEIKEWFVHGLGNALTVVSARGLRPRASRQHNGNAQPNAAH